MNKRIEQIESNMVRLKELTDQMTHLTDYTHPEATNIIFDLPEGKVEGFKLKENSHYIIIQVTFPKGCKFPKHTHEGSETLIVLSGQITCYIREIPTVLKIGDAIKIDSRTTHWCEFNEETNIVSITIPKEEAFCE
jgi:quercetin dioxygenase-like cupin family protein